MWQLAKLDDEQLAVVRQAEQSLQLDYLLVYRDSDSDAAVAPPAGLRPARLSDSEMECLRGMEHNLGAVAVAYAHAGA